MTIKVDPELDLVNGEVTSFDEESHYTAGAELLGRKAVSFYGNVVRLRAGRTRHDTTALSNLSQAGGALAFVYTGYMPPELVVNDAWQINKYDELVERYVYGALVSSVLSQAYNAINEPRN